MQTNYFAARSQSGPDGAGPSINMSELISPEVEINSNEGDEYLDDEIRIKDQPYESGKREKN
jgi:hypothetical protein